MKYLMVIAIFAIGHDALAAKWGLSVRPKNKPSKSVILSDESQAIQLDSARWSCVVGKVTEADHKTKAAIVKTESRMISCVHSNKIDVVGAALTCFPQLGKPSSLSFQLGETDTGKGIKNTEIILDCSYYKFESAH